jgi:predicted CXXCH cytochrome family protein
MVTGWRAFVVVSLLLPMGSALALDPPHNSSNAIECLSCHTPHGALGNQLTAVEGNANLCMSCHTPAGMAATRSFADIDQALPGVSGTSHRWDSGPSGHVEASSSNTSTGLLRSAGTFSGRIENNYVISITSGGEAGVATFSWSDNFGDSGSATTGDAVLLNSGLSLNFINGDSPDSFVSGDSWTLFVLTDLRLPDINVPAEAEMAKRLADEKVVCSVCHDQHDQEHAPWDPLAPAYAGDGTGEGRHHQRADNNTAQMCRTCHSARDVTSATQGSHPIGITIPATADFQTPADLPLDPAGRVQCPTCHNPHFTDSGGANGGDGDGYLLRKSIGELCYQCHTLADNTSGSHFNTTTGALWNGNNFGSTFPAHDADKRGFCINCHWPHGWPDDSNLAADYPQLWVEQYDVADDGSDPDDAEDLCFACHTPAGSATTDLQAEFNKGTNGSNIFHHPVKDSEQSTGRSVECVDCHNPHKARADNKYAGVAGVDIDGNPVGEGTANDREIVQYELCFKCHGDTYNSARVTTNKRLDFQTSNSSFHPVVGAGNNQSTNLNNQLRGGLSTSSTLVCIDCHNSDATNDAFGPASNSTHKPQGPHGSTNAAIRRGQYFVDISGPGSYSESNFELCFFCHDPAKLVARRFDEGASTNFYDDIDGKDNLHWVHLEDRIDKSRATCKNCHYNVHSNRTADNTQYLIDGVLYTSPPAGFKTMLINFSPDIDPFGGRDKPEWRINTSNRNRQCYLSCHGTDMEGSSGKHHYRPDNGGDHSSFTIP